MKSVKFKTLTITLTIMLVLLSFLLCGCAQVNLVTYHNDDGSLYEYVFLNIDEQALISNGYNIDNVKLEIQTNSRFEANSLIEQFKNKTTEEYELQHLTNNEYAELYNGISLIEENWNGGQYLIGLNFKNSTVYKKYYELMNGVTFNTNPKIVKKLFYTKTYYYGTANYGDYSIFNRIYNYYAGTIFSTISPQETSLTYSYSVSSKRFHSDADQVTMDSNGNYLHTWKINPNEPAREILLYTISANRGMWIIVSIGIGLGTTLLLSSIALIKYFKNKK